MDKKREVSGGAEKAEKLAKGNSTVKRTGAVKASENTVKSKSAESKRTTGTKAQKPTAEKATVKAEKHEKTSSRTAKKSDGQKGGKAVKQTSQSKKNKPVKQVNEKKQAKKEAKEQKKLHAAQIRAERKAHRLEKKLEHKQAKLDRIAAAKERREERKAAKQERRDLLKNETKAMRIERKRDEKQARLEARVAKREAAAADRRAKREHRLKLKAEKRAARNERRHAPGFGGWLAAVISLGVTTLALGTLLTFGWINMNGMQAEMASVHTQSLYELNSVVDNLDTNLSKARVTSSSTDRVRVLSDIAVESEMAEVILERLPLDITMTEEMASFINKMSDSAQNMLFTVANGGELSESQIKSIDYMYRTNLEIKRALNELVANADGKDVLSAMRGKGSILTESFTDIQNNVIESPKGIQDGPFADSVKNTNGNVFKDMEEISAPRAEELAKQYFTDYDVKNVRCTGEVIANSIQCYNVVVNTKDGDMLAQLSKNGGKVVMFDSYKDCNDKNFSVDRCITIAEDFLSDLGFENMKAVWSSENGTVCSLNFAPVQDGVILYPDLVKVKVCEQRGMVTGMEAMSYVLNHTERDLASPAVEKSQAQAKLNGSIEVSSARLALIPFDGSERLAYEFFGESGDNEYYVYVDAKTGEEIEVLTVIGTAQGKALM